MTYRDDKDGQIEKLKAQTYELREQLEKTKSTLLTRNEELVVIRTKLSTGQPKKSLLGPVLLVTIGAVCLPPAVLAVLVGLAYGLHAALALLMPSDVSWVLACLTSLISVILGGFILAGGIAAAVDKAERSG